ncbi:unnamed protein product [Sphagnum troendelagicum]|uniref:BHLH domain-containing protein n=1 Tax=Sphagnum troendelagicum TaxID=128251 RepID=A0ABP0V1J0_9BRYO
MATFRFFNSYPQSHLVFGPAFTPPPPPPILSFTAISQEDVSGVIQAAACRESNDEYTGNKRKETHSDASKESNTARYFTETKTERSSSESNSGDSSSPSAGAAAAAAAGNMRMKENVKTLSGSTEPAASKQDYVHVRARRGQATDSHSLAERVRREKISERMKYLQELVPGCSKVTGKAVMLDEIINYVQSLQQQVEFLSMKLAAVNPQLDFNLDSNLKKEILQSGLSSVLGSELTSTFGLHQPLLTSHLAAAGPDFQSPLGTMDSHLCRTISAPTSIPFVPNLDAYGDDDATQMSIGWDREMQGMLHMGFGQTGQATSSSLLEGFNNCQFGAAGHMKVELGK